MENHLGLKHKCETGIKMKKVLLKMIHGNEYPKEDWEYIEAVAKKYLNKKMIKEIIDAMEKDKYQYDYPNDKLYKLF